MLHRVLLVSWFLLASIFCLNTPVLAVLSQNTADIFNTGVISLRQQDYQRALVNFTQVIDRQDNLVAAAYSNRCLVNLQLQNYAAAEADCTTAVANNSHNLEAYLNLGLAYYRQGKYEKAIAQNGVVIQLDKKDYRAYYNRGLTYLALNNYQKAIADYQTALSFTPDSNFESKSLIYNDLALAYMMLAENERAIFNFDRAIALNRNNYNFYFNRGCARHHQEQYKGAIEDFSQVIRLQPNFTQAYINRGILQYHIGHENIALTDLNIALQQYQNQGDNQQYDLVFNLKQKLFYTRLSQLV